MAERLLLLADVDGTVTQNPPILSRLAVVQDRTGTLREGCLNALGGVSARYNHGNGDMTYEQYANGLLNLYAEGLMGISLATVLSQIRESISDGTVPLHTNVSRILRNLQNSHDLFFVTASPQFIGQAICERFLPSRFISSVFEVKGNILTGRVSASLASGEAKLGAIQELVARYPKSGSVALGDSIGDIRMLEAVERPVCISPDNELLRLASARGYQIIQGVV